MGTHVFQKTDTYSPQPNLEGVGGGGGGGARGQQHQILGETTTYHPFPFINNPLQIKDFFCTPPTPFY